MVPLGLQDSHSALDAVDDDAQSEAATVIENDNSDTLGSDAEGVDPPGTSANAALSGSQGTSCVSQVVFCIFADPVAVFSANTHVGSHIGSPVNTVAVKSHASNVPETDGGELCPRAHSPPTAHAISIQTDVN